MARRSAPPNSGPAYIGRIPAAGGPADDGNAFTNFIREEVSFGRVLIVSDVGRILRLEGPWERRVCIAERVRMGWICLRWEG